MCVSMDLSIEAYASLMAELDTTSDERDEVLARHGLDEEQWDEIDTDWQKRLTAELEGDEDGVPLLVATYAAAYQHALRSRDPPISLAEFARVLKFFQASGDLQAALAKAGVTLADYLRSNEYWTHRMAREPDEEQRFYAALRGDSL